MALQWMILTHVVAAEVDLALFLTLPSPKLLKNHLVSLSFSPPSLSSPSPDSSSSVNFVYPFKSILRIYWKNEHRLMCTSEIQTIAGSSRIPVQSPPREMASHVVGYPRMGPRRELKLALESFWDGKSSAEDLQRAAADLMSSIWKQMADAGIKYIPSNTFSYFDQVLDTTAMLGAVPTRYGWDGGEIGFEVYFSMARGNASVPAMEMAKWFDTNYHYIVPELGPDVNFSYASHKAVTEYKEAKMNLEKGKTKLKVGPTVPALLRFAHLGQRYLRSLSSSLLPVLEALPLIIILLVAIRANLLRLAAYPLGATAMVPSTSTSTSSANQKNPPVKRLDRTSWWTSDGNFRFGGEKIAGRSHEQYPSVSKRFLAEFLDDYIAREANHPRAGNKLVGTVNRGVEIAAPLKKCSKRSIPCFSPIRFALSSPPFSVSLLSPGRRQPHDPPPISMATAESLGSARPSPDTPLSQLPASATLDPGPTTVVDAPADQLRPPLASLDLLGVDTVPVLLGPVSYLLLSKPAKGVEKTFSPLSLLGKILPIYREVVSELKAAGASWIQFDEPTLVVTGFGFDLVRGTKTLDLIKGGFPTGKYLFAGVVDGRNIWANDLAGSLSTLHALESIVGKDKLVVSTSCSLLHTPVDLDNETKLDEEIKSWLAFAAQKVVEVNALAKALAGQKDEAFFSANAAAQASRKSSPRVTNEAVQKAIHSHMCYSHFCNIIPSFILTWMPMSSQWRTLDKF
ncbi:hypothetical protein NL676_001481 [Syzygium grande]|nr:hypothetical protein NL676_001481 [Syzygium grande]